MNKKLTVITLFFLLLPKCSVLFAKDFSVNKINVFDRSARLKFGIKSGIGFANPIYVHGYEDVGEMIEKEDGSLSELNGIYSYVGKISFEKIFLIQKVEFQRKYSIQQNLGLGMALGYTKLRWYKEILFNLEDIEVSMHLIPINLYCIINFDFNILNFSVHFGYAAAFSPSINVFHTKTSKNTFDDKLLLLMIKDCLKHFSSLIGTTIGFELEIMSSGILLGFDTFLAGTVLPKCRCWKDTLCCNQILPNVSFSLGYDFGRLMNQNQN